ncbi:hypothetical protein [Limnobacter sp.]|uniref:hypothetical protein n=1 Tax=Limnobacter sp. TaxID=2003368 RepID=UPI003518529C
MGNPSIEAPASHHSNGVVDEQAGTQKSSNKASPEQREEVKRWFAVLNQIAEGDYSGALSSITEIRTKRMREEMQALTEMAEEYGPLESAADNLIHRLLSVGKDGEVINLNSHMREFVMRAQKAHPPQSDTTENSLGKLLRGEKLSEAEAKDLHAYFEEAKLKVIPQGKRVSLLTEQIKSLQNNYEQELANGGQGIKALLGQ